MHFCFLLGSSLTQTAPSPALSRLLSIFLYLLLILSFYESTSIFFCPSLAFLTSLFLSFSFHILKQYFYFLFSRLYHLSFFFSCFFLCISSSLSTSRYFSGTFLLPRLVHGIKGLRAQRRASAYRGFHVTLETCDTQTRYFKVRFFVLRRFWALKYFEVLMKLVFLRPVNDVLW